MSQKIWLTPDWYILVDEQGYLAKTCYQGALGSVVPITGQNGDHEILALKIPRMLADTVRENAYIAKVTEDESEVVHAIAFNVEGGVGLMTTKLYSYPLRYARSLEFAQEDGARQQHGHVIFLSFTKNTPPRFCSAKVEENDGQRRFSVFPRGLESELGGLFESWDKLKEATTRTSHENDKVIQTPFAEAACFFAEHKEHGASTIYTLKESISAKVQGSVWYTAVPAIAYEWGSYTIERLISDGIFAEWKLKQCLDFFHTVLTGLNTLQQAGLIHGDIRPANIMAVGDFKSPERYKLIDYGSFSRSQTGPTGEPSGNTMVGTGIGPQRATPFYASERRAGIERESADTAIILQETKTDATNATAKAVQYIIKLGWRQALLGIDGPTPLPENVESIRQEAKAFQESTDTHPDKKNNKQRISLDPEILYDGDRLRLQDYLFEVKWSKREGDTLLCCCKPRYAKIFHERLAIYDADGAIKDETVLDLSRYVEYRQWSAASDIYSIGAVFLYCLFASAKEETSEDAVKGLPAERKASVQARFSDLIEILENVSYFRVFWPELEKFRSHLEAFHTARVATSPEGADLHQVGTGESDQPITLRDLALRATNNIVQSAPHAKVVLLRCEDNLAKFLLIMHFVLSCLHRSSDMLNAPAKGTKQSIGPEAAAVEGVPFANSRLDPPQSDLAAAALRRIDSLRDLFYAHAIFEKFKRKSDEVPDFNPQFDPSLRSQNNELKEKLTALETQLSDARNRAASLSNRIEGVGSKIDQWKKEAKSEGYLKSMQGALLQRILTTDLPHMLDTLRVNPNTGEPT